jgi:hypothetical protein
VKLFAKYAEKTADAVSIAEARLASLMEGRGAGRPDGSDLDELIDWKRAAAANELEIESAEESLAFHRAAAARQAAIAEQAELGRQYNNCVKLVSVHSKLTIEIVEDSEKLVEKLARHAEIQTAIEQANSIRGERAFIVDGEVKVRQRPGRIKPAEYRDEVIWEDRAGIRCSTFRRDQAGELVPYHANHGFTRKVLKVCQAEEREILPTMPDRLCDAITLVDLHGRQIWPRP